MMLGGSPIHSVRMTTWTSEISGSASSGMRRSAQIPARTSASVPVKTRKRLRVHQSIQRVITLRPPFRRHVQLLPGEGLAVTLRDDRHLPRSTRFKLAPSLVNAPAAIAEREVRAHG